MKYRPQQVPVKTDVPTRSWLDTEHKRLANIIDPLANVNEDETITGDWTFEGATSGIDYNDLDNLPTLVTDHGALTGLSDDDHPQYAAIAQNETVTGDWTFDSNLIINGDAFATNDPALYVTASDARIYLRDSGGSTDEKMWGFRADSDVLAFSTRSDDDTSAADWLTVSRTGTTVNEILFSAPVTMEGVSTNGYALILTGPTSAAIQFIEEDAAADEGKWDIVAASTGGDGTLRFRMNSDAEVDTNVMVFTRQGTTCGSVGVTTTLFNVSGALSSQGNFACNGQTPAARPDYTLTSINVLRSLNGSTTLANLEDVVGTLINDLIAIGLLQ